MKISTRKNAKEAVTLGQVDGVVVNGGGPVNTTNFRKDFEEAAAKLEKLLKIGDTTTGEGKSVKAEQLKIEPAGTPNPAKEDKKKEPTKESIGKVSFEDICEMPEDACVVPGVGGDIEDWKLGLTNSFGLKNPTFIECSGADMNNKFALKGNSAYPADYKFLIIPVKAYERPRVMEVMKDYDCKWLSDFNQ